MSQNITLEDIWLNNKYKTKTTSVVFNNNDSEIITIERNSQTNIQEVKSALCTNINSKKILFDWNFYQNKIDSKPNIDQVISFPDPNHFLIITQIDYIYRRSFTCNAYFLNLNNRKITLVDEKIREVSISPNGEYISYINLNGINIFDIKTSKSKVISHIRPSDNTLVGHTDWVYEEEFEFTKAYEWSHNSEYISYLVFDQSNVKEYNLQHWNNKYPTNYVYKYPKAGEKNSIVSAHIFQLKSSNLISVIMPTDQDCYYPRMKWTKYDHKLALIHLNRNQNKVQILHIAPNNGVPFIVYQDSCKTYLEINQDYKYLENSPEFILSDENQGFRHIFIYNFITREKKYITSGNWDLQEIEFINEKNKEIYFTANINKSYEYQLYRIGFNSKKLNKVSNKLGCHDAEFSKSGNYFILRTSTINKPTNVDLIETKSLKEITLSQNNIDIILPKIEFESINLSDSVEINAWVLKSENSFSANKSPLLINIYGGPNSQKVLNKWIGKDFWWYQMLAQKGITVVCLDPRSTGGKGEKFRKCSYLNLGNVESIDLIEATKKIIKKNNIDTSKISIWGWSYGGYLSAFTFFKGNGLFQKCISVAPVTDWRFYDNIYTERYMKTPELNIKGYDSSSLLKINYHQKGRLMLVHGTGDDNVHVQNSYEFEKSMIDKKRDFELMIYPDKNHGILGEKVRYDLYKRMTNFILR